MAVPDIVIIPNRLNGTGIPTIQWSGASGTSLITTQVQVNGDVVFNGSQGSLFSIVDQLTGSLMSVTDISALPILEVFSDDRVVMGTFNANTLVVSGRRVGIGTASPLYSLDVTGQTRLSGGLVLSSGLIFTAITNNSGGGINWADASIYRVNAGQVALDHTNGTNPVLQLRQSATPTLRMYTNNGPAVLETLTSAPLSFGVNSSTALTLNTNTTATFSSGIVMGQSNVTGGGIAFGSSANIWSPATNQLAFGTAGLTAITINNAQSVGIGAAPSAAFSLDVTGAVRVGAALVVSGQVTSNGGVNDSAATAYYLAATFI